LHKLSSVGSSSRQLHGVLRKAFNSAAGQRPVINRWANSQAGALTPNLRPIISASLTAAAALSSARAACKAMRSIPNLLACRSITAASSRSSPSTSALQRGLGVTGGKRVADAAGPIRQRPGPAAYWEGAEASAAASSLSGLALEHGVHRPIARSRWNPSWRNVGVSLEGQLNDTKHMPDEDCGSALPDVTERAKEVIPVQHRSRVILPALVAVSRSRSHGTKTTTFSMSSAANRRTK
jgi:hypothetical protein